MKTEDKATYVRTVVDHISGEVLQEEWVHKRGVEPPFILIACVISRDCLKVLTRFF